MSEDLPPEEDRSIVALLIIGGVATLGIGLLIASLGGFSSTEPVASTGEMDSRRTVAQPPPPGR
jgi:hypothetical protein